MKKIEILEELRDLIPPLQDLELEQLHRSIDSTSGPETPLKVWKEKDILIDGHHRYAYCTEKGYDYDVQYESFINIDAVKDYMILHQLGRRNVDPKTASYLRGKLYKNRKQSVGGQTPKQKEGDQNDPPISEPKGGAQNGHPVKTAEKVAQETGVSKNTIKRDEKFADAVDIINDKASKGEITQEEKKEIMSKPKSQIIKESKGGSNQPAKKAKKLQPFERVVKSFKGLQYEQQCLAIEELNNYWENL